MIDKIKEINYVFEFLKKTYIETDAKSVCTIVKSCLLLISLLCNFVAITFLSVFSRTQICFNDFLNINALSFQPSLYLSDNGFFNVHVVDFHHNTVFVN